MSGDKRKIGRKPQRGIAEQEEIYSILDEGLVAHIGFVDPTSRESTVIPVAYARSGNRLLFHGSTGSRMFLALKSGVQICATVTLLDGIVSARTPFNSSMNYRSVMAFGVPKVLEGTAKIEALRTVSERLIPGLWDVGREQTSKEFAQTMLVELELDDVTAKKREGGALDDDDAHLDLWVGQVPIVTKFGQPIPNQESQGLPIPEHIQNITAKEIS